jgi:hypothetical protein
VTSIHEFVSWPDSSRIYQELYRDGDLPLRIQLCPCVWGMQRTLEMEALLDLGLQTGFGNDWIKFGSAKIFVDGERHDETGVAKEWPRISQDRLDATELAQALDVAVLVEDRKAQAHDDAPVSADIDRGHPAPPATSRERIPSRP